MVNSSRATALVKVETKKEKRLPTGLPRDLILTTLDDTAKALSINYAALGNYIDNDPEMRALTVRHREAILDNAEDQLRTSIQSGNMTSVRFALSTLGRERGYVQRTEKDIRTQDIPSPKSVDISQLSVDQLKLLAEIMESTEPH
jgi:hypothetical protein